MKEKIIAFIASVKEREQQLKIVLESIYGKVNLIHLALNFYKEVPEWMGDLDDEAKIFCHLNPENKNAHDTIWTYVEAENAVLKVKNNYDRAMHCEGDGNYYFILDDDLVYPQNYFDKLIETIEKYERKAVITVHGANVRRPIKSYFECRCVYGFSSGLRTDIYVDMAGCGTVAFHSSTIRPTLQDFPVVFCRDLWFSILCKKNNVPIISVARPTSWIAPLPTSGDTVYDATHRSKNLQRIKNRILKEVFAPLLFCNRFNDKYCLITDYDFDKQLLTKSLSTLAQVSNCNKIIFSNKVKSYGTDIFTQYVIPEEFKIGRMGSKVLSQYRFIKGLKNDSKVISADADLYYLKDPFTAFGQDFDIAVTTRPFAYHYPINGGVVMFRVNDKVRNLLDFIISQILERTWPELIEWQNKFNHTGNDWYIDQDIWNVAWLCRDKIKEQFGVKIVNVGATYNYCPHADGVSTEQGKQLLMAAYNEKAVAVLHLKSRLKELLTEGLLK